MLTPEYLYRISEASEEISGELHEYIIRRIIEGIMNRIGRGEDYLLTARDRWMIETLQEAGYVLEDIQHEIQKKTRLQEKELKEAMEEAGVKALEYDDLVYALADIPPADLRESPHLIRLMQRNYEATLGTMKNFTRTTATAAQRLFLQEVDNAYTLVSTGTVSYTKAVKDAVEKIAEQGVTVTYPSGRKDTIEAATLRAVRTGIAQSTAEISLARMEETDWDIILTSAHIGARTGDGGENPGNHYWWQGRFFSRTGRTKEFPDFKTCTGYGTVEGLDGANCRHSFGPGDGIHNPFKEFDKEENRKIEKLNQRQRLLERRIRKTKRELQGMKAGIDACQDEKLKFELQQSYDRKAHLLQKQNDAYADFCDRNNLKKLQDRLRIAKWDRKQAAEARGAAKRYQTAKGDEKPVEKEKKSDIINTENTGEVIEVHTVGKINRDIYKCVTNDISTDEVIITDERIMHIKERHPNDYERFCSYIPEVIKNPDYIIKANKPDTATVLKEIMDNGEKFQLVLRLKTSKDRPEFKNSVITFLNINERTWNKYLRNKEILYRKE